MVPLATACRRLRLRVLTLYLYQPFHTCTVLQVMELQGNIRVFCRVRPFMEVDAKTGDRPSEISCLTSGDRPKIQVPLSFSLSLCGAHSPTPPTPSHTHRFCSRPGKAARSARS